MGGVVYYANYLRFIERARSDWVASLGLDQRTMAADGRFFVVARIVADYAAPARFGDALEVVTRALSATGARLVLGQEVRRDGGLLFAAEVTLAATGPGGRPTRLPDLLRGSPAG